MLAAVIYLLIIAALIRFNGFFGLFRDSGIHSRYLILLFIGKALAVPAFYLVYNKIYGSLQNFDSGKFYNDVQVINSYAWENPLNFLKILFGFQNDSVTSQESRECLSKTLNWDNGLTREFRINDNRFLIRIHVILHFVAFNSWWVHALFSCFFSFAGIIFIYRAFREFFIGKEMAVLLVLSFFPSLWFFSGGFLKEGLTIMALGAGILEIKKFVQDGLTIRSTMLLLVFCVSLILKPYLLLWSMMCFFLYFFISTRRLNSRTVFFAAALAGFFILLEGSLRIWKSGGLFDVAIRHQQIFRGVASGGIFLTAGDHYVQLKYDTSQIKPVGDSIYTIKKGVSYMYWDDADNSDTLYNRSNKDTLTHYNLVFMNPEARSNLPVANYKESLLEHVGLSIQNSLLRPFFYQVKGLFGWIASVENLVLVLSLLYAIKEMILKRKQRLFPLVLICFVITLLILYGITTPNTGAILRYRSPVAPFLILAALYFIPAKKQRETNSV